jgi:hypothetical protein
MDAKMDRISQLPGAVELANAFAEVGDVVTATAGAQPTKP